MPTTVQVQLNPEYLKFPGVCVCCGGPDERNLEMAVSSTDRNEYEQDLIMEVELPYCLECYDHADKGFGWGRLLAVLLSVSLVTFFSAAALQKLAGPIAAVGIALFAGYFVWECRRVRQFMKPACTAQRGHVLFAHPTDSRFSTVTFTNDRVAESFKELNRFNVVEH